MRKSDRNIAVIGSSGHAKVVIDIIEREGKYRISGLIDSFRPAGETSFGYRIVGKEDSLRALVSSDGVFGCIVAIGDNWQRHLMVERISALVPQLEFVSSIHPSAQIARGVAIGRGTVIMAGTVVNSDCRIGEFCIVNTRASIDHDSVMGEFSSLGPNATTGGDVRVGAFSAVALGASLIEKLSIGVHTIVGAGAVVLKDLPDHCVAHGVPARVVRPRREGDRYI